MAKKVETNEPLRANIGIAKKNIEAIALILNKILADEEVLYAKTRNYHWNVTGPHFHALHIFLESQYNDLQAFADEVAERVRQLGHYAIGSLTDFLKLTHLSEKDTSDLSAEGMIKSLVSDHEAVIMALREAVNETADNYKDAGTADLLTGLMEKHEKMAWMLRAHIGR